MFFHSIIHCEYVSNIYINMCAYLSTFSIHFSIAKYYWTSLVLRSWRILFLSSKKPQQLKAQLSEISVPLSRRFWQHQSDIVRQEKDKPGTSYMKNQEGKIFPSGLSSYTFYKFIKKHA